MSLKCSLGLHDWNKDCELCSICWESRTNKHKLTTEDGVCSICNNKIYDQIGNFKLMSKNLDVDRFRNGDKIPKAKNQEEWKKANNECKPAWCYYEFGDAWYNISYGKLYNWYAVNDKRGLAPEGWHIPDKIEFKVLKNLLNLEKKSSRHRSGYINKNGICRDIDEEAYYWSSDSSSIETSRCLRFSNDWYLYSENKGMGLSCLCVKGNVSELCNEFTHDWDGCKCKICGETKSIKESGHDWNGCKCIKCDQIRDEQHSVIHCKCQICLEVMHNWVNGKCSNCSQFHKDSEGWTDLHWAIKYDANLQDITDLCKNGLVNIGDKEGFTPLMKASGTDGNIEIVKLLILLGANVNDHSIRGTTALSMAALHGNDDIYYFLLANGAKVDFVIRKH